MKSDKLFLSHILEAIVKIEKYTNGLRSDDFLGHSLVQDGVMRQLEIIGEAVKNLSSDAKQARP
ncbi:MAG TPA: HepT-like ribonuclease domain-containing protein, partial [Desulfobacterales bacterium]|nr:HepT-like ribonuclease domain-containing protein [Desulfobacterales bacterium]